MIINDTPTNVIEDEEPGSMWLVQNLGPDVVYVARTEQECTDLLALVVAPNEAIAFEQPARTYLGTDSIWVRTDDDNSADVRTLEIG